MCCRAWLSPANGYEEYNHQYVMTIYLYVVYEVLGWHATSSTAIQSVYSQQVVLFIAFIFIVSHSHCTITGLQPWESDCISRKGRSRYFVNYHKVCKKKKKFNLSEEESIHCKKDFGNSIHRLVIGLTLNENLNWKSYINNISNTISKSMLILNKL